ncbi:MAG: SUMF1/EgtB/PvdO family nonheme iron enzyme [Bacteroidia bacterium]|nr:SUMF1/EgtB/PvdO family nonheme iron enzyme [Bacteroidia bacterium]
MRTIKLLSSLLLAFSCYAVSASGLTIENVRSVNRDDVLSSPMSVIFDIRWDNAWNNAKNHDAVWVFLKYNTPYNNHVKILPTGHQLLKNRSPQSGNPTLEVADDGMGFFIIPPTACRGSLNYKLQVLLDTTGRNIGFRQLNDLKVHGIEMVYIPQGPFTLGSPDEAAITRASLYKSDANGEADGLYQITSEAEIQVGPQKGNLYYWSETDLYNGDQKGPIPAEFPKGFEAFYIMKYELNQGQYAAFLNSLPSGWTFDRSPIGGKDYYTNRGSIRLKEGKYVAESPNRPMNYVSFSDGLAFTDWAALRPITELEYTKASRGPRKPIEAEFVWGTNTYADLERYVSPDLELGWANGVDESQLHDNNLPVYGASYYWVMDLSGSVWEKVITLGNPIGRAFTGTHGDGKLNFGEATNEDWPKSDNEVGGFGYRGGGYYQIGTSYSDFNPHSPIGYRYYGAWSGGPRSIAYGYRAGRSADR